MLFRSLISGEIKVTSWEKSQVQVRATSESGDLRFNASPRRVSLGVEDEEGDGGDTQFEIVVPKDAHVITSSISGDLSVRGVGELEANTISGELSVNGVAGRASLQSVSGEIIAGDLGSNVRAQSVSGDITLTGVAGDLEMQTVSGEMHLRGAKSAYIRTQTVSGDFEFEGALDPKGRYEFHSHSGSFTLTLPRGAGAQITMRGFSGDLSSSCEMTLMPGSGEGHYKSMTFMLGNCGAHVNIETISGDVEIKGCGGNRSKED